LLSSSAVSVATQTPITGASLRGTVGDNNTFKGLAKGTKRNQGWFYFQEGGQSNDPIQRVVLTESPIDAMSFAVLDRNDSTRTIYLSTDGAGQGVSTANRQKTTLDV
jgi:hypothetical protein